MNQITIEVTASMDGKMWENGNDPKKQTGSMKGWHRPWTPKDKEPKFINFDVSAAGWGAKTLANARKGDKFVVSGRIGGTSEYTRSDGTVSYSIKIFADDVQQLVKHEKGESGRGDSGGHQERARTPATPAAPAPEEEFPF